MGHASSRFCVSDTFCSFDPLQVKHRYTDTKFKDIPEGFEVLDEFTHTPSSEGQSKQNYCTDDSVRLHDLENSASVEVFKHEVLEKTQIQDMVEKTWKPERKQQAWQI
ncbi:uncharacterized protein LOC111711632 [Eurytemora carolleeae]|uniref:uncharacterized protein LOC111711632 n=1 Tax=Eurytemora carolleeae TaxID=1294199 RepID=UPI000C75A7EC|nr:uncharacterized protein LOC111711632 [Eurytemora carolleeae]|eukprot:XP_023341791.1 uncharacterized protein LOC111711632 [Eurytemora affinis]